MAPEIEIIYGPPGTGKTTELMRLLEGELSRMSPSDIAYVSFTKEGSNQGRIRAMERFGYKEKEFPHFRTLHSSAFRALNIARSSVMSKEQYKIFSEKMGMHFTGYYTEELHHDDDLYLFFDELYRNNASTASVYLSSIDVNKLKYVRTNYVRFKKQLGLLDFTDMIERFCDQRIEIPVRVAFIDEAQDLTTLQWKMIWTAFRNCEKVYIAGDDDQAIYQWSGADVNYFLGIEGNVRVLRHSYRLPDNILRYAKRITRQISKRVNKEYEGIGRDGIVEEHNSLEDIPINRDETYMFLSRNNTFLSDAETFVRNKSLLYRRKGVASATKGDYDAINLYESCRSKGEMTPKEKSSISVYTKENFFLSDPWYESFSWPSEKVMYFRDLVAHKVSLSDMRTSIGTIHSSKGAEADNVILFLDVTKNVMTNIQNNPDSEHRVFYVGATRAKRALHIVHAQSKYAYSIY